MIFVNRFVVHKELCEYLGAAELYVNSEARCIAPIRLTGNYGSEIVRGNVAFKTSLPREDLLAPEFAQLVKNASITYTWK